MNKPVLTAIIAALSATTQLSIAAGDNLLRQSTLQRLETAAPPIIRQCIIDRFNELPNDELSILKTRVEDTESPMESMASTAIDYLSESCFQMLNFESLEGPGDDPWRNPKSFAEALQSKLFMASYDFGAINELVSAYNEHQNCLFGLSSSCAPVELGGYKALSRKPYEHDEESHFPNTTYPPQGHSQIRQIEAGGLFALLVTQTTHSHTPMVDGGSDQFRTVFFRKSDMAKLSEHDGLYLDFSKPPLMFLSKTATGDCSGTRHGDTLLVLESMTSRELARVRLPDGVSSIESAKGSGAKGIGLLVSGQKIVNDRRAEQCELPYWAKHFTYRYSIHCDAKSTACHAKRQLVRMRQGCADIGGCD